MWLYFICAVLFPLYIRSHGPGLNFIDVSLLTIAVLILLPLIIIIWPHKHDK